MEKRKTFAQEDMEIRHLMPLTSSSMASFDANKMRLLNSHKEKEVSLDTGLGNNFQLFFMHGMCLEEENSRHSMAWPKERKRTVGNSKVKGSGVWPAAMGLGRRQEKVLGKVAGAMGDFSGAWCVEEIEGSLVELDVTKTSDGRWRGKTKIQRENHEPGRIQGWWVMRQSPSPRDLSKAL
ncbi:hypothetical protein MA16_Dca009142 [Dendrobium catenatum]|uniref:Uncharacterized protein n=1 Tax=Dendrobium catenatum TaxID=906689 RepID=A0A2I0VR05_9ASPA|nr:hypothetical protein MA16_Dca009142 [Dendrobium catenatum]